VKIIIHGPAAGPDYAGMIQSWAPDQPVDVDDSDKQAVTWARNFVSTGLASLIEDVAKPVRTPAKQAS
jgi:hypothetical protein